MLWKLDIIYISKHNFSVLEDIRHHWLRQSAPNKRQAIEPEWFVYWTIRHELQWNFSVTAILFIQANALESFCTLSVLFRPKCINCEIFRLRYCKVNSMAADALAIWVARIPGFMVYLLAVQNKTFHILYPEGAQLPMPTQGLVAMKMQIYFHAFKNELSTTKVNVSL